MPAPNQAIVYTQWERQLTQYGYEPLFLLCFGWGQQTTSKRLVAVSVPTFPMEVDVDVVFSRYAIDCPVGLFACSPIYLANIGWSRLGSHTTLHRPPLAEAQKVQANSSGCVVY
jgi:hypothetical protein